MTASSGCDCGNSLSVYPSLDGGSSWESWHVFLPRSGHVGGGAIVLFDLHITGGDGKATAAAAWRRASGGKEGEGASIGQALDSAIIPPALPHSLPPRPPLFRDRAGDEESGDSVYGGRPSHALPCRGLAGNIQEEGRRTVGLATLPQIVFAVAAFPSLGPPLLIPLAIESPPALRYPTDRGTLYVSTSMLCACTCRTSSFPFLARAIARPPRASTTHARQRG